MFWNNYYTQICDRRRPYSVSLISILVVGGIWTANRILWNFRKLFCSFGCKFWDLERCYHAGTTIISRGIKCQCKFDGTNNTKTPKVTNCFRVFLAVCYSFSMVAIFHVSSTNWVFKDVFSIKSPVVDTYKNVVVIEMHEHDAN